LAADTAFTMASVQLPPGVKQTSQVVAELTGEIKRKKIVPKNTRVRFISFGVVVLRFTFYSGCSST
jgi:hypothetical protein